MGRPGRIPSHEEEVVGRVHYRDQRAVASLARCLRDVVGPAPEGADVSVAVVCIGTDRSTGDALGPLVGSYLRRWAPQLLVYGTLEEPVHATNLSETLARLKAAAASFVLATFELAADLPQNFTSFGLMLDGQQTLIAIDRSGSEAGSPTRAVVIDSITITASSPID